jgi:hypothetical protein
MWEKSCVYCESQRKAIKPLCGRNTGSSKVPWREGITVRQQIGVSRFLACMEETRKHERNKSLRKPKQWKVLLKWIIHKYDVIMWTGLNCLYRVLLLAVLKTMNDVWGFLKKRELCNEVSVSHRGLCPVDLVTAYINLVYTTGYVSWWQNLPRATRLHEQRITNVLPGSKIEQNGSIMTRVFEVQSWFKVQAVP